MTRREDPGKAVPQRCHHEGDAAHAVFVTVAQIGLAMKESERPVAEIGALFARLSETLGAMKTVPGMNPSAGQPAAPPADPVVPVPAVAGNPAAPAPSVTADPEAQAPRLPGCEAVSTAMLRGLLQQLQTDVFNGIQQLQFYDRLVQHLSHIQDYLIAIANEMDSLKSQPRAQEFWDALHERLRKRLISDEQRGLLELYLMRHTPTRVSAQTPRSDYSPPGDLEIF
jgi:hypothetical protein